MTVNNRFIPNVEAAPLVETDIFDGNKEKQFALVAFGLGLRENDELFTSYLKLRSNVYVHQTGILSPDVIRDDGTEIDKDDERSSHFLVLENRLGATAAVGCIRLIEKSEMHPKPLPIETFFPEVFKDNTPGAKSVEVSRFISCLNDKPHQLTAILELFRSGLARIKQEDLGPVFAIVEEELEKSLGYLGAPPKRLADPEWVEKYNSSNVGIEIDTAAMVTALDPAAINSLDVSTDSVRYWGNVSESTNIKKSRIMQRIA